MKNSDFYYNRLSELKKFINHYNWMKDNNRYLNDIRRHHYNINIIFKWYTNIKKYVAQGRLERYEEPFTIYLDADDIEYLYNKYKPKHDKMVCDEANKELA